MQRKFLNEYRAQVKTYEPVLRERGRMCARVWTGEGLFAASARPPA